MLPKTRKSISEISDPCCFSQSAIKRLIRKKMRLERKAERFRAESESDHGGVRRFANYETLQEEIVELEQFLAWLRDALEERLETESRLIPEEARNAAVIRRTEKKLRLLSEESSVRDPMLLFKIAAALLIAWALISGGLAGVKTFRLARDRSDAVRSLSAVSAPEPVVNSGERIETLFERIRAANVNKNIELYASCFSSSFPELAQRKMRLEKNWKEYAVTDLRFALADLKHRSGQTDVTVHWNGSLRCLRTGQKQMLAISHRVTLRNENGGWRIASLR